MRTVLADADSDQIRGISRLDKNPEVEKVTGRKLKLIRDSVAVVGVRMTPPVVFITELRLTSGHAERLALSGADTL